MYVAYNLAGDMVADGFDYEEALDAALALGYLPDEIEVLRVTP